MSSLMPVIALCLIANSILAAESDNGEEFTGKVISVIEGDTFLLQVDNQRLKIGIDSIESPERDEPFGEASRKALSGMIDGREVTVIKTGGKKSRLTIGIVTLDGDNITLDGDNIGRRMVQQGWARQLKKSIPNRELDKLEENAREQQLGIWSDEEPDDEDDQDKYASLKKTVRADVEQMNAAVQTGELIKLVDLTHPKAVELVGGRKTMVSVLEKSTADMKKRGLEIVSSTTASPSDPVIVDGEMYIVVPHKMEMKAPNGKLHVNAFVIGVSTDEGKSWKYVNGDLTHKTIKEVLPNLPEELKLPAKKAPVFEKGK